MLTLVATEIGRYTGFIDGFRVTMTKRINAPEDVRCTDTDTTPMWSGCIQDPESGISDSFYGSFDAVVENLRLGNVSLIPLAG